MLIGYMRPYENDLDCKNQLNNLIKINCDLIISENHSSAKKRTELNGMLTSLNQGDKVAVAKLFTLADSTRHLVELLDEIHSKGAFVLSLKEGIDTSHESGAQFYYIVRHLLEFQSDVISEKTKKGLTEAKQKGIATGRPRKPDENVQKAIIMYQSKKYTLAEIKNETGISKSTLYRYLEN
ncbi:resolvase [Bacillus sp. M6-12]|uniref:recombinase family protein n=1 Tax=Bacillus sp. M6-12 TaxID=2054166 RepID=UPI000C790F7C|nr:recombinase family protein [Bacillus sp. M6-12]PLS18651.1 resolvase [Bacillus sp. M6-12]